MTTATKIKSIVKKTTTTKLTNWAEIIRRLNSETFAGQYQTCQILSEVRNFITANEYLKDYYYWVEKELGFSKEKARFFPEIFNEFKYGKEMYPFLDFRVLYAIVRIPQSTIRTKLRQQYSRRVNQQAKLIPLEDFKWTIYKLTRKPPTMNRYTLQINPDLYCYVVDNTQQLSKSEIINKIKYALRTPNNLIKKKQTY